jgi:hypothetical protein
VGCRHRGGARKREILCRPCMGRLPERRPRRRSGPPAARQPMTTPHGLPSDRHARLPAMRAERRFIEEFVHLPRGRHHTLHLRSLLIGLHLCTQATGGKIVLERVTDILYSRIAPRRAPCLASPTTSGSSRSGHAEREPRRRRLPADDVPRRSRQGPAPHQAAHPRPRHSASPRRPGAQPRRPLKVCRQRTITISPEADAKHWQPLEYGGPEWQKIYFRLRNSVLTLATGQHRPKNNQQHKEAGPQP